MLNLATCSTNLTLNEDIWSLMKLKIQHKRTVQEHPIYAIKGTPFFFNVLTAGLFIQFSFFSFAYHSILFFMFSFFKLISLLVSFSNTCVLMCIVKKIVHIKPLKHCNLIVHVRLRFCINCIFSHFARHQQEMLLPTLAASAAAGEKQVNRQVWLYL